MAAGAGIAPAFAPSKGAVLRLDDPASFKRRMKNSKCRITAQEQCRIRLCILNSAFQMVEPEVVATSPYRIKSPVPVCCGFDSLKLACQAVACRAQCELVRLRCASARQPSPAPTSRAKAGGRERTCTSKAHRFSICGVCCSRLTTRPKIGAPTRNCTELIRLPSECIAKNALGA